ncbi:hypothetical protein [Lactococcus lactis]|uniref:Uncharacterized protein n=1 Tax=Lactococcus lactis TaxID=1358 RepID=A0A6B3S3R6_9LACT|nr:hypothetical protein [Lactococcus lactis]NEX49343.1 hypothetical protein [Lactococcus lactis]NEX52794.1 hypothetical protein [Lactococcus lactis]NEX55397.1 hypothetical protein [Lactococcus lactis]
MHNFHWTPKQWADFSMYEKAVIVAGIDTEIERMNVERKKLESEAQG